MNKNSDASSVLNMASCSASGVCKHINTTNMSMVDLAFSLNNRNWLNLVIRKTCP